MNSYRYLKQKMQNLQNCEKIHEIQNNSIKTGGQKNYFEEKFWHLKMNKLSKSKGKQLKEDS